MEIHNGIDIARYNKQLGQAEAVALKTQLHLPIDVPIITTVGRLHPQKGHSYLLKAIPEILRVHSEVHFLWVGDGSLSEELKRQVDLAGLSNKITFAGVRSDIPDILAISNLFVLPSLWEGLPNVVLEAMAAGVPVVATNVDGTPELIKDGETGWLISPADTNDIATTLTRVLSDPAQLELIRKQAFQFVKDHFTSERNVEKYISLYKSFLKTSS